jgi:GTP cyclohydrolase I
MLKSQCPANASTNLPGDLSAEMPHSSEDLIAALVPRDPDAVARAATQILRATGENLSREGLRDTPQRFSRAISDLFSGYEGSVEGVVGSGVFPAEGPGLVSVRDVEFYSLCEHHLLPFWGKASVAYYPNRKILGLSKIPRIIDYFSRRVQVQERITEQVADAILEVVDPRAVAVRVTASHLCMMMRGVHKQGSETVTEATRRLDQILPFERDRLLGALL